MTRSKTDSRQHQMHWFAKCCCMTSSLRSLSLSLRHTHTLFLSPSPPVSHTHSHTHAHATLLSCLSPMLTSFTICASEHTHSLSLTQCRSVRVFGWRNKICVKVQQLLSATHTLTCACSNCVAYCVTLQNMSAQLILIRINPFILSNTYL